MKDPLDINDWTIHDVHPAGDEQTTGRRKSLRDSTETEQAVALGRGDFVAWTQQWLFTQCAGGRCQRSGGRGGGTHRLELVGILGDTPRDVLLVPLALRVR